MAIESKNYIISVQAILKGDKVVVSGLQQIDGAVKKFTKTVSVGGDKTQDFNDILTKVGQRALIVAPIWLALRSAMMLALSTISNMLKANFDLEDSMADIKTMLQGTGQEIEAQMMTAKRAILDTSANSRTSISDLADAFRFLKSANLDFQETMAGFPVVARLMNAFGLSAEEASRAIAGMANTARTSFGDTMTVTEKFAKIGDILAYTYVKQDVLVGELIDSYSKLAPYITSIDDDFGDVITTLGFLNTNMLRASRAGTITARALVTMAGSSDKLAQIFGITFDAKKPISFLNVIEQLNNKLGEGTAITAEQTKALQETFGIRASVAVNLLVANFDKLKEAIADARDNTAGFLERIEQIKMDTITAQTQRLTNLLAILTNDFISGVYGVNDFAQALKLLNETIVAMRPGMKSLGEGIGYQGEQIGRGLNLQITAIQAYKEALDNLFKSPMEKQNYFENLLKNTPLMRGPTEYFKEKDKEAEAFEEEKPLRDTVLKLDEARQERKINAQKEYTDELKHEYDIMKANGVNDLDIQKAKVESFVKAEAKINKILALEREIVENKELQKSADFEALTTLQLNENFLQQELQTQNSIQTVRNSYGSDSDYEIAKTKEQNDLLVEQIKYREKITDNLRSVVLDLMKQLGTDEANIITLKMRELEVDRQKIGNASYLAQSESLRLQRIQAVVNEKLKERQIQAGLILDYQKADETERARIRRVIELRKLSATELGKQYETSPYDAQIIESNLGKLKTEQQEEIIKKYADKYGFEYEDVKDMITDTAKENPLLSDNNEALRNLTVILQALNQNIGITSQNNGIGYATDINKGQTIQDRILVDANVDLRTAIAQINIMLPDDALSRVAEEAGKAVTDALTSNEELAKKVAKIIRPYV